MARLLLLALATSLTLAACSVDVGEDASSEEQGEDEELAPRLDPRTLVEVQDVARGAVSDFLVSNGSVESVSQADLTPETTGTVIAIKAEEGDVVRKGQVLAVIDNASLDAAYTRAQAELLKAEAEFENLKTLSAEGAISRKELADAEYAVQAARTSLEESRQSQGNTRLVSPINGTVSVRDLRYGEVAGGTRAFQVVDLDHLRVVVQLPERDLARLRVGQSATLTSVYDTESQVEATVARISPTVDATTGTVRVTIALPEGERTLRPGQFVSVRVEIDAHEDVLVVPRRSVVYEEGEPMVFQVSEEEPPEEEVDEDAEGGGEGAGGFSLKVGGGGKGRGGGMAKRSRGGGGGGGDGGQKLLPHEVSGPYRVAHKIPVELGFVNDDDAEIISGLEEGDDVVVVGQSNLREGAWVRYVDDITLKEIEAALAEEAKAEKDEADAEEGDAEEGDAEEGDVEDASEEAAEAAPEEAEEAQAEEG